MSKPWSPPGSKIQRRSPHGALSKPSRIRRQPVQLVPDSPAAATRKSLRLSDTEQMWFGVTGVLLFAAAIVVLVVAAAIITFTRDDPAKAARARLFSQCDDSTQGNCVVDGDTIYVRGTRVEIGGIAAPLIRGAQCDTERTLGLYAAVKLENLLNSGRVTIGRPYRDEYGRVVRKVQVKGADVGPTLIEAGLAQERHGTRSNWCS